MEDGKLILSTRNFAWLLQTIHQAHHDAEAGAWRQCPLSVCRAALGMEVLGAEDAREYEIYLKRRRPGGADQRKDGGANAQ